MKLDEALDLLRGARPKLEQRGVVHAAVFGSVARGEARADSDVDVFVEISPDARVGIWELAGIFRDVQELFPLKVDVSEFRSLRPFIKVEAKRDAVFAF